MCIHINIYICIYIYIYIYILVSQTCSLLCYREIKCHRTMSGSWAAPSDGDVPLINNVAPVGKGGGGFKCYSLEH